MLALPAGVVETVLGVFFIALIPVRLSALAPAEITPLRPIPITSPMDGVVSEIVVKPNQIVKADELLAKPPQIFKIDILAQKLPK